MDALRKAEEAKKLAEQNKKSADESKSDPAPDPSSSAPAEEPAPLYPELEDDLVSPQAAGVARSNKLDVSLELETEPAQEPTSSKIEMELEPRGSAVSSFSEPEVEAEAEVEVETEIEVPGKELPAESFNRTDLLQDDELVAEGEETPDSSQEGSEATAEHHVEFYAGEQSQAGAEASAARATTNKEELGDVEALTALLSDIPAAVLQREQQEETQQRENTHANADEQLDLSMADPAESSHADGNDDNSTPNVNNEAKKKDRTLAQSVFAAKRPEQENRRNIKIAAAGIAATLVLSLTTYFYMTSQRDSGINLTVPAVSSISAPVVERDDFFPAAEPSSAIAATSDTTNSTTNTTTNSSTSGAISDASEPDSLSAEEAMPADIGAAIATTTNIATEPAAEIVPTTAPIIIGSDPAPIPPSQTEPVDSAPEENEQQPIAASSQPAASDDEVRIASTSIEPATSTEIPASGSTASQPVLNTISFTRRTRETNIDPLASSAYEAYQQGDIESAESLYRQLLELTPLHRDALIGLAAIAQLNSDPAQAMDLYSRLLARDPTDALARASLLELMPNGSAAERERQFKRLISRNQNVAPLHYALGNFYAVEQRWTDAQQAYFSALQLAKTDAITSGRVNPDYAFNLAISLEHLQQAQPAQTYYEQALEFAVEHPASFDLNVARSRLRDIREGG